MKSIKTSCNLLALIMAGIMLTSCGAGGQAAAGDPAAAEKHQRQVFAMDTVMILTAYGPEGDAALAAAEERILALEADLDPESPTGSVHALNTGAGGFVTVSEDCYSVMSTALDIWQASGGALDPGIYPLSKAWGFIGGDYRVPGAAEIDALLAAKDTGAIRLDEAARAAEVPAGMEVSFGAVAKGYTAQVICDLLAEMGVESAILSLGGNVQTLGAAKPDGSRWQVAVTDPRDTGDYVGILETGQTAVVTSGGYQRFFEQDGVTYIHILDPVTGYPVDNDLLSVTVVTADGARADALSTALFVLGTEGALELYRAREDFELVLITKDDRVIVTAGLADSFRETAAGEYTYEYPG